MANGEFAQSTVMESTFKLKSWYIIEGGLSTTIGQGEEIMIVYGSPST